MDWLYKKHIKIYLQNNFQVSVANIFQPKCIWPDVEDITASSN